MMKPRIVGDLAGTKTYGFGWKSLWGWGVSGFMLIEGAGFVLASGSYLYLMTQARHWPLSSPPPSLLWGSVFTLVMIVSQAPNLWAAKGAARCKKRPTRLGTLIMVAIGLVLCVIRAFEFANLNTRWDQDAYGSIVWALMVLHTTHLLTDLGDTIVLGVFLYTHPVTPERYSDVDDNGAYWLFVLIAWLPIYALVYWAPRLAP
jgi:cytochrome c oxidase subunit 3